MDIDFSDINVYLERNAGEVSLLIMEITRTKGRLEDYTIIFDEPTETFNIDGHRYGDFNYVLTYILKKRDRK